MNTLLTTDERYMRRCIELAEHGLLTTRPNPMVSAVLVADGRIIGEGYHIRPGEGHAEVNAFASVAPADEQLIPQATLYVSLEPCAHHGKTPPYTDLIIRKGVRRVVVGCVDPFQEVSGRGIARIREAGISVDVGVLEQECRWLNRRFLTFHEQHRPYILLKWAQTADGFIDRNGKAMPISTAFTRMLVHKLRSEEDAILVGHTTDQREHPQLDSRLWGGRNPLRLVLTHEQDLHTMLHNLYEQGRQSLIVEGGAKTHAAFVAAGLWDELRIETSPQQAGSGTKAINLPEEAILLSSEQYGPNRISRYIHR